VRRRYTRREPQQSEPDLVPVMNLACLLVPLLLMGTGFAELAVVEVTLPAI